MSSVASVTVDILLSFSIFVHTLIKQTWLNLLQNCGKINVVKITTKSESYSEPFLFNYIFVVKLTSLK